jgi:hypothetical protein
LEADAAQLEEDTPMAIYLQQKVRTELHYSERRLVAIVAYYKALGMSKGAAAQDAARSADVGVRTVEQWKAT